MSRIQDAYRAMHEQAFVPIFVHDHFSSESLLEGCLEAGLKCVEYTLRREDAHVMIPRIRERYPGLYLLVGSTLDDEGIVRQARRRHAQLLTLRELDGMGVDGFVSMVGYAAESIRRYARRRIVVPSAFSVSEALREVGAGAHFAKIAGDNLALVRQCRHSATFGFCPILVTGGMSPQRIPEAVDAGAVVIGSGFDLILKGRPAGTGAKEVAQELRTYVEVTRAARAKAWPELRDVSGLEWRGWLERLPHHHPFGAGGGV
jgi:2-keto-3-deoxy-6-phosphogluconate aldolase